MGSSRCAVRKRANGCGSMWPLHFRFLTEGFLRMRTEAGVISTSCGGRGRAGGSVHGWCAAPPCRSTIVAVLTAWQHVRPRAHARIHQTRDGWPTPHAPEADALRLTSSSAMYCKQGGREGAAKLVSAGLTSQAGGPRRAGPLGRMRSRPAAQSKRHSVPHTTH